MLAGTHGTIGEGAQVEHALLTRKVLNMSDEANGTLFFGFVQPLTGHGTWDEMGGGNRQDQRR